MNKSNIISPQTHCQLVKLTVSSFLPKTGWTLPNNQTELRCSITSFILPDNGSPSQDLNQGSHFLLHYLHLYPVSFGFTSQLCKNTDKLYMTSSFLFIVLQYNLLLIILWKSVYPRLHAESFSCLVKYFKSFCEFLPWTLYHEKHWRGDGSDTQVMWLHANIRNYAHHLYQVCTN